MTLRDHVRDFIAARCTVGSGERETISKLYAAFEEWWRWDERWSGPHLPSLPTRQSFGRALHYIGHESRGKGPDGSRLRLGLRLAKGDEIPLVAINEVELPEPSPLAPVAEFPAPPEPEVPTDSPPDTLSDPATAWWREVDTEYKLSTHQRMTLTLAAQTWDRAQRLEAKLRDYGSHSYKKASGDFAAYPEVSALATANAGFRQLVRELGFDLEQPAESRPPRPQPAKGKR